jgi:putative FmdB family regulatory protein
VPAEEGDQVPTYQYACTECGHALEAQQSFTDEPLTTCPECTGRLRKVFSAVGVVFKGSGFYRTDSRADSSSNGSSSSGSGSATSASGSDSSSSTSAGTEKAASSGTASSGGTGSTASSSSSGSGSAA